MQFLQSKEYNRKVEGGDIMNAHSTLLSRIRHTNRTMLGLVTLVGVCLTFPAYADQPRQPTVKSSENIVANLHLPDGSIVQFHEPVPGEVAILAQTPVDDSDGRAGMVNGVDPKNLEGLDPLEIYSTLSGGLPAPPTLIEAQQRAAQARLGQADTLQEMAPEAVQPDVAPPFAAPEAQAQSSYSVGSGDWFRENYCIWRENFCYCYLYRTGYGSVTREGTNMDSTAYPYWGNITQKLEYYDCFLFFCGWNTSITQTVYEGYVGHIWAWGSNRTRRASLLDADGDAFHWAVYGGELGRSCSHDPIACACWNS